ncbi:MAG: carbohydrate ABC transporter permease [Clostridiaceae bacterium]|nr:carbohydrate ABC transporter permease [Clostridiaceae bacterium]
MKKKKRRTDILIFNITGYIVTGLVALLCLVPFVMILSASFSEEKLILKEGFSLLPRNFSLEAYRTVFEKPEIIGRAYLVTTVITIIGTILGLTLTSMTGYVLQRKDFEWRNRFSFFFYFTTLFSGGIVPYYILMVRYLRLKDSYLALILPLLFNVFNLIVMKNYMNGIPVAFTEAAIIDGCGDFSIYYRIILPLSKPVLATIGLFITLAYWNDWYNSMLYINDDSKYTLQYFLYMRINNIEAYKKIIAQSGGMAGSFIELPTQTLRMALTVVVTGPIIFAYPFAQKYFVKGITIGAIKG